MSNEDYMISDVERVVWGCLTLVFATFAIFGECIVDHFGSSLDGDNLLNI